jgi:hypothetical protein
MKHFCNINKFFCIIFGRTILKWILKKSVYVDWIDLAQDGEQVVVVVINIQVPLTRGNFRLAEKPFSSQGALSCM